MKCEDCKNIVCFECGNCKCQEFDFKKIFDQLLIKCIATGDQKLWNHLYPFIKELGYVMDKNLLTHFGAKIDEMLEK